MMESSVIEQRLNELTIRLNALESRMDRASPDVMLKEMLDIKEELGALKQITEYLEEKIDALSEKVDSLESKINELEKNLKTEINTVKNELTDRINTVEKSLRAEINTVKSELIDRMNTTETNLRKEIFEIGKSVSSQESKIDLMMKLIIGLLIIAIGAILRYIIPFILTLFK